MTDGAVRQRVTLATRVRVLRGRFHQTVESAAEHGGLASDRWHAIEAGARPSAGECLGISWALGVSLDVVRGRGLIADAADEADVLLLTLLDTAEGLEADGLLPPASASNSSA